MFSRKRTSGSHVLFMRSKSKYKSSPTKWWDENFLLPASVDCYPAVKKESRKYLGSSNSSSARTRSVWSSGKAKFLGRCISFVGLVKEKILMATVSQEAINELQALMDRGQCRLRIHRSLGCFFFCLDSLLLRFFSSPVDSRILALIFLILGFVY